MYSFKTADEMDENVNDSPITVEAHYDALRAAMRNAETIPVGRLWGLPDLGDSDMWVDIAGAAVLAQVKPKTLTGWLSRGGPKKRPFPAPTRLMHRLYWRRSTIEAWRQDRPARPRAAVEAVGDTSPRTAYLKLPKV